MARVFHRRLAIPLWAMMFFTVALAAPPPATLLLMSSTTLFAIAVVGIAVLAVTMPGCVSGWRPSRSPARVKPSTSRDQAYAGSAMAAGIAMRTLEEPNESTADDAIDLVRMDDDGGWQLARPPA